MMKSILLLIIFLSANCFAQKIDTFFQNSDKSIIGEATDVATKSKEPSMTYEHIKKKNNDFAKYFGLHNVYGVGELGMMFSVRTYFSANVGVTATYFNYENWSAAAEVKFGLAANSNYRNIAFNFAPVVVGYKIPNIPLNAELSPDIYCLFYDGGTNVMIGLFAGAKYHLTSNSKLGLRVGYYNGFYSGISYYFKIK